MPLGQDKAVTVGVFGLIRPDPKDPEVKRGQNVDRGHLAADMARPGFEHGLKIAQPDLAGDPGQIVGGVGGRHGVLVCINIRPIKIVQIGWGSQALPSVALTRTCPFKAPLADVGACPRRRLCPDDQRITKGSGIGSSDVRSQTVLVVV